MSVQTFGFHPSRNEPDQAQRRIDLILLDIHDREWHAVFDTSARGVVNMYPRFAAPWMPDTKYVAAGSSRGGIGGVPDLVTIDYRLMLEDNHRAWDKYFDNLLKLGTKMPGVDAMAAYTHAKDGAWEKIPSGLLAELGQSPPSEDYIKAAMAGNKWVLGLSAAIPAWAAPLVAMEEAKRKKAALGVEESELDKYRDEEEFVDPDAVGGKVLKVKRPKF